MVIRFFIIYLSMQAAIIDFLEVERNRKFEATLNIDGYDFTAAELRFSARLMPEQNPVLVLEDEQIFREQGETDWVVSLAKTAEEMNIPTRSYLYDLTDIATNKTIFKGRFEVI